MYFNGCDCGNSETEDNEGFFDRLVPAPPSPPRRREGVETSPGVFGVLRLLPKVAKAPLPRPKADDAPVGEGTTRGEAVVKE